MFRLLFGGPLFKYLLVGSVVSAFVEFVLWPLIFPHEASRWTDPFSTGSWVSEVLGFIAGCVYFRIAPPKKMLDYDRMNSETLETLMSGHHHNQALKDTSRHSIYTLSSEEELSSQEVIEHSVTTTPAQTKTTSTNEAPKALEEKTLETRLNLNTASEQEISALPGVGPQLAKIAVTYRTSENGFNTLDAFIDLLGIDMLHAHKIEKLAIVRHPHPEEGPTGLPHADNPAVDNHPHGFPTHQAQSRRVIDL